MDGVLIADKEKGYTSFDVVAKLRGILGQKKIGHLGTLDPEAEGVLPVLLGRATKLAELLSEGSKVYRAVLYLGAETDRSVVFSAQEKAQEFANESGVPLVMTTAFEKNAFPGCTVIEDVTKKLF